jgi:hypothetical protein
MNKLGIAVLACLSINSAFADHVVTGGASPEAAGRIAGLAKTCGGAYEPALPEFIRQSMEAIEVKAKNADEYGRGMSGFVGAFADSAFTPAGPADCARLESGYEQTYRDLRGAATRRGGVVRK